jgi:lipopolysaccharide/colanic/teichoic acid biosynthesis glycosyltransferase
MGQKEKVDANIHQKRFDPQKEEEGYRLLTAVNRGLAFILIVLLLPVYMVIAILVMRLSGWPIFFIQKRTGYRGKTFRMFKFRTMKVGAEEKQYQLRKRNEADGPVFKIRNDPRFTKIGKILSHSGLDELPQLINVIKGEMEMVGPRPLPIIEAKNISLKYRIIRESVRPGIISPWVLKGYHGLNFENWMKEDKKYVENKSWWRDGWLLIKGVGKFFDLLTKIG